MTTDRLYAFGLQIKYTNSIHARAIEASDVGEALDLLQDRQSLLGLFDVRSITRYTPDRTGYQSITTDIELYPAMGKRNIPYPRDLEKELDCRILLNTK